MSHIPTAEDWKTNPDQALAFALEVAAQTSAHGDPKTGAIALGIAAKVVAAAAPIVGGAIGGAGGALAGAAIAQIADQLGNHSARALDSLSPEQQALITQAIALGADALAKKAGG